MIIMHWDGTANFRSYDDVEKFENYPTLEALHAYRSERLALYAGHIDFIARLKPGRQDLRIVEIGSGSSALLYALEQKGLLESAIAIELSKSRFGFAEKWKSDAGFQKVANIHSDFSKVTLAAAHFDLYLAINDTLTYLEPENAAYPDMLLKQANDALRADGHCLLEVPNGASASYESLKRNGKHEFSVDLPDSNAFRRASYHHYYNAQENRVRVESVYYAKDGSEKRKLEFSYLYDQRSLSELLSKHGFEPVRWNGEFDGRPYDPVKSGHIVVTAAKR